MTTTPIIDTDSAEIVRALAQYGYSELVVVARGDGFATGSVRIDGVSPSGVRFRLYSMRDVDAALYDERDGYCPRCGAYVLRLADGCDGCGYDIVLGRFHS